MLKKNYTHLFFDLDHTLWDTDTNAKKSLVEMYTLFELDKQGIESCELFTEKYLAINHRLWDDYSKGKIEKAYLRTGRFELTLECFGIKNKELIEPLANYFVSKTPYHQELIPFTRELLEHLQQKYKLYIITNGFKEAQHTKLRSSSIDHFFSDVFISEEVGYHKPNPEIFKHAVQKTNALLENCLMIGDNPETDIEGAIAAQMDCVYLNPMKTKHQLHVTYETHCLSTLMEVL
jgi:putative hydrolase of the HAD superfamily